MEKSRSLYNQYRLSSLRKSFPWVKSVRAGIACVVSSLNGLNTELLLVTQRTGYRGLPKGLAEPKDFSALHTAMRECKEETGIDITKESCYLSETTFIIPRRKVGEILIYFIALMDKKPQVTISEEIVNYEWVNVVGLKRITDVSKPTLQLFRIFDDVNFNISLDSMKLNSYTVMTNPPEFYQ